MVYNTQRKKLQFTDYGRNIYNLIEYAKTIEDREERTKAAGAVVNAMAAVSPVAKESSNWQLRLWTHMMIMSDWQLDVDIPEGVVKMDAVEYNPEKLPYTQGKIRYRHYGRFLIGMVEAVKQMEDSEEKTELVGLVANAMKRLFLLWNNDAVSDEVVAEQLKTISGGALVLPSDFVFIGTQRILNDYKKEESKQKRRKKK